MRLKLIQTYLKTRQGDRVRSDVLFDGWAQVRNSYSIPRV
jgi:hypothetical protein